MGWARLDDKRAKDAKFRRLGFAVRGLDEAAICEAAHDETDGWVMPEMLEDMAIFAGVPLADALELVTILVQKRRWHGAKAARSCPECVTKWEHAGNTTMPREGWMIHGWLERNESRLEAETRRERDRKRKTSQRIPSGIREDAAGSPSGIHTASTKHDPTRPDPTRPDLKSSSSSDLQGAEPEAAEEDSFEVALDILTARRRADVEAAGKSVRNPKPWGETVRRALKRDHAAMAALALKDHPTMTGLQLADWLEPPPKPSNGSTPHVLDEQVKAQAKIRDANMAAMAVMPTAAPTAEGIAALRKLKAGVRGTK